MSQEGKKPRSWVIYNGHLGAAREFISGDDIAYADNVHVVERKAYDKAIETLQLISKMRSPMGFAVCPSLAKETLKELREVE